MVVGAGATHRTSAATGSGAKEQACGQAREQVSGLGAKEQASVMEQARDFGVHGFADQFKLDMCLAQFVVCWHHLWVFHAFQFWLCG